MSEISPQYLGTILIDVSALGATLFALVPRLMPTLNLKTVTAYASIVLAMAAHEGLYRGRKEVASEQFRLGKAITWASLLTILLLTRIAGEMAAFAFLSVASFFVLSAWRCVWPEANAGGVVAAANVLVVGSTGAMEKVSNAIRLESASRHVKAELSDWQLQRAQDPNLLSRIAREEHIDEVVIAGGSADFVSFVVAECSRNALDVVIVPELEDHAVKVENLGGLPFIKISQQSAPEWNLATKRVIDALLAGAAAILALPFMCAIAIAIKLDSPGPVLYRSTRVGRKGAPFTCYKFRTMLAGADCLKQKLRFGNERQGAFFKISADPRITRVGRWLRRYSLDELPQLWNVLRGDMSLVGPRPHPPDDVELYSLEDLQRLDFVPGMTGLWQVVARNDPSFERCVTLDIEYINRWSVLLDLRILARTLSVVLSGNGA